MNMNMAFQYSSVLLVIFLFSSSFLVNLGMSDSSALDQLLGGQGGLLQEAQCVQKLMPCQEFLKSPNNPTPACCDPLKEMHDNNPQCLCNFVNKTPLFQSVSTSNKEEILKLPKACGIDVDFSTCNTTQATTTQGAYALPDEDSDESTSSMITPHGIIYFGAPGFVALLTALLFSSY